MLKGKSLFTSLQLRLKLTVSTCLQRVTASEQPQAASQRLWRATLGKPVLLRPVRTDSSELCTQTSLICHPCCSLACSRILPIQVCWNPGMSFPVLHWESWMKHVLYVTVYAILCSVSVSLSNTVSKMPLKLSHFNELPYFYFQLFLALVTLLPWWHYRWQHSTWL